MISRAAAIADLVMDRDLRIFSIFAKEVLVHLGFFFFLAAGAVFRFAMIFGVVGMVVSMVAP